MSHERKPLSVIASRTAAESKRSLLSAAASLGMDPSEMPDFTAKTDPVMVAVQVMEMLVTRNTPRVVEMGKQAANALGQFGADIDAAAENTENAMQRFNEATNNAVVDLRNKRMAISGEVRQVLASLKDVHDFLKEVGPFLRTMTEMVHLARALRETFGEGAMDRLAEALLIATTSAEASE